MGSPYVKKPFEEAKGRHWASSCGGVARLENDGRRTRLTDRLGNSYVYFLGDDRGGTVWVESTRGVYRRTGTSRIEARTSFTTRGPSAR